MSFYRIILFWVSLWILFIAHAVPPQISFMVDEAMRHDVTPHEGVNILDSVLAIYGNDITVAQRVAILRRQGELAMKIGMYHKASRAFAELKGADVRHSTDERLRLNQDIATCSYFCGEYPTAFRSAFNVIASDKPDSLRFYDIEAYITLSNLCLRLGQRDEAWKYLDKADSMIRQLSGKNMDGYKYKILLGRSGVMIMDRKYSEAYRYLKDCDIYTHLDSLAPFCRQLNLAIVCGEDNGEKMAEHYYDKIMKSDGLHYNKCVAINNYADWLISQNRPEDALRVTEINRPQLEMIKATHALGILWILRKTAFEMIGEYKRATQCGDSADYILLSMIEQDNGRLYANLLEQHEDEIIIADYKDTKKNLFVLTSVCGALLIAGIILGLLWRKELTKRRHRDREKAELTTRLDGIMARHEIDLGKLKGVLDKKNRELVQSELKRNQLIETITAITENKNYDQNSSAPILANIARELKTSGLHGSDWDTFQIYFEEIDPGFYNSLLAHHPDLTQGEKRMCAFIRAGMKNPEIASLCHRSTRTVESIKYRLKKKMGLSNEMTLDHYLSTLVSPNEHLSP